MTGRSFRVSSLSRPLPQELKEELALFLDFDGTLVSIAPRPEQVFLDASTRRLLKSIASLVPVVIVSGRSLRDIRKRVSLAGVTYVGNHGLEIADRNFQYTFKGANQWRRGLQKWTAQLRTGLENIPGVLLENKGYTLSIHYRLAEKESRRKARKLLVKKLSPLLERGLIRITPGKAVWEIRPPVAWDKGKAVLWILRQPAFQGRWPLYIGDDETDQDVFRRIRKRGIGIMVGPPHQKGSAHFTLPGPKEVRLLLKWLFNGRIASV